MYRFFISLFIVCFFLCNQKLLQGKPKCRPGVKQQISILSAPINIE